MPKWPLLVVMLLACSEGDELEAPMLGDCSNCNSSPSPGGGIRGGGGADASFTDAGDANVGDASETPDGLDIVDTGVPSDLDAPINP